MERHFERELERLKDRLMTMAGLVETNLRNALRGLTDRNPALAQQVIGADRQVDSLELEIDNLIIDLLALHSPVASDLRLIVAAQKINNDLERVGDHAVNIAQSAHSLTVSRPPGSILLDLPALADAAMKSFHNALIAFQTLDATLARDVLRHDDIVDDLNRSNVKLLVESHRQGTFSMEEGLDLIRISRNLERVGDLATNIAEEVVFLAQARVVKHHAEDPPAGT
jgi:phosphate transport system protein